MMLIDCKENIRIKRWTDTEKKNKNLRIFSKLSANAIFSNCLRKKTSAFSLFKHMQITLKELFQIFLGPHEICNSFFPVF